MDNIDDIIKKARQSAFNKHRYEVTIRLRRLLNSILLYTDYDKCKDDIDILSKDFFTKAVPAFQRDNNKWSKKQKILFVENVLKGFKTNISLFRFSEDGDAQIIDGLQRLTALTDFIDGKIKAFGYSYEEYGDKIKSFPANINLSVYTFDTWEEVGRFYIEMNEGITHSKEDIQKAKNWFFEVKNIKL